jgi:hypothetical protein
VWTRMEQCEQCGSDNMQLVEDRDDSVGYSSEEWRCLSCGANCEVWKSARRERQERRPCRKARRHLSAAYTGKIALRADGPGALLTP